ncbi:MAG: FtsX-like permease family protein, partial [Pseudomonadota bacterium]
MNRQFFSLAWLFCLRELRGGIRGFRIFLLCLIMGVAAIAAVGALSESIEQGLQRDSRQLLGGDVDLRLTHKSASDAQLQWLQDETQALSQVQVMRAMAVREDRENSRLVEVKAVDSAYPLVGGFALKDQELGEQSLHGYLLEGTLPGAVVAESLLDRLNMQIGDRFRLGEQIFAIKGVIGVEPDRSTRAFELGPRVIIAQELLPSTDLIKPGSLIRYHYRVTLDAQTDFRQWQDRLGESFPDAGWRVRNRLNAAPNIAQFIDRVGLFLTLVGLTALLIGGVGIGNAIRSYVQTRRTSIAILKSVGAQGNFVFVMCFMQISFLAILGILVGMGLGAIGPVLVADLLQGRLPVELKIGFYPQSLMLACMYGILVTLIFSIPPLDQARNVTPAMLFRHQSLDLQGLPRKKILAIMMILVVLLFAFTLITARDTRMAAGFLIG